MNGFVNRAISERPQRFRGQSGKIERKHQVYSVVRFTAALYGAGGSDEEKQVIESKGGIATWDFGLIF